MISTNPSGLPGHIVKLGHAHLPHKTRFMARVSGYSITGYAAPVMAAAQQQSTHPLAAGTQAPRTGVWHRATPPLRRKAFGAFA